MFCLPVKAGASECGGHVGAQWGFFDVEKTGETAEDCECIYRSRCCHAHIFSYVSAEQEARLVYEKWLSYRRPRQEDSALTFGMNVSNLALSEEPPFLLITTQITGSFDIFRRGECT